MHSKQSEGFFKIGIKNLDPIVLFISEFKNKGHYVVVSPDIGSIPRARIFACELGAGLVIISKSRNCDGECIMSEIIGNVAKKDCLIVEDIVDTGSTLCKAASC